MNINPSIPVAALGTLGSKPSHSIYNWLFPIGYEDETGFHYGQEPADHPWDIEKTGWEVLSLDGAYKPANDGLSPLLRAYVPKGLNFQAGVPSQSPMKSSAISRQTPPPQAV
jgi:hypothetical protein